MYAGKKILRNATLYQRLHGSAETAMPLRKTAIYSASGALCYWTVVELEMPMVDLARKFDITPAAVNYAVQRGEKMAKERGFQLET